MGRSGFKGDGVKVQPPYSQVHDQLTKRFTRPDKGTARVNESMALFLGVAVFDWSCMLWRSLEYCVALLGPTC